ncbi:MAG TPA: hypothetical protein VHU80_00850 [Polyangiaceae bacterium]|nr:hypothetical protein [Polyangiaceae bacterium]
MLVASVGVATLNYLGAAPVACGGKTNDHGPDAAVGTGGSGTGGVVGVGGNVGNLMPPPTATVANLMAPPPFPTVANLMAPPPIPSMTVTVANLLAPPPMPTVTPPRLDASIDAAAPAKDAGKSDGEAPKEAGRI